MKNILYEISTYLIIRIARYRERLGIANCVRVERDAINLIPQAEFWLKENYAGFEFECCDCGLVHNFKMDKDGALHCLPLRPINYKYKLR